MSQSLKILLVEDDPADAELMRLRLSRDAPAPPRITHVVSAGEACQALSEGGYDVVLLDLTLPDSDGLDTVRRVIGGDDGVPIVVVSGHDDEALALHAVQSGAEDYLLKGEGSSATLLRAISYAVERKRSEVALRQLVHTDPLTGLCNRADFEEQLGKAVANSLRSGRRMAVLFLDFDGFKAVNDSLGHAAGDELLRQAARRIVECVRQGDTVARLGGDEFVLIAYGLDDEHGAGAVASKIHALLGEPFRIDGEEVRIGVSIGVAVLPRDGRTPALLLERADSSMYEAKRRGRGCTVFSHKDLQARVGRRDDLLAELGRAAGEQQLVVHYQPVVAADDGRLRGFEALLRWAHPRRGLLVPDQFLPLAEANGLVCSLDLHVLDAALAQAAAWRDAGLPEAAVAVNVSALHFSRSELPQRVGECLSRHGLAAQQLTLELPEAVLMRHPATASQVVEELAGLGVRLCVQDLGTGLSSLGRLARWPLGAVKIDRALVAASHDPRTQSLVEAMVLLARRLGLSVAAEGVASAGQRAWLGDCGCELLQGFLFGRPESAVQARRRLEAASVAAPGRSLAGPG